MQKVISVSSMQNCEQQAISAGSSVKKLMQSAAQMVFNGVTWKPPVAIVCGAGNNAGDGYALASILQEHKISCKIFLTSEKFSEAGKFYFELAKSNGVEFKHITLAEKFKGFNTIVDCIFGTGYRGKDLGDLKTVINNINSSKAYVVSVDINSGLASDNGLTECAVHSDLTVAVGSFKYGHFLNMAKDVMDKVVCGDIGLPVPEENTFLFEESDAALTLKKRKNFSNKGDFGYISLICGSKMYSGAAKLANLAACAMASGAGVVKLAVPDFLSGAVLPYLVESTLFPLSCKGESLKFCQEEIETLAKTTKVIAFGMGVGDTKATEQILKYLTEHFTGTLILDADALNCVSRLGTDVLTNATCKLILTPHVKEFSRLSGKGVDEVLQDPVELSKSFAGQHNCILLLKGPTTLVTDGSTTYFVCKGCSGMATAGSGDVLSGILAAVCGYNHDRLLEATATAALINGLSGELAEKELGAIAMTSSDTISKLGQAVNSIKRTIKTLSEN